MPVGVYISIPFCRSKCSYCNFASGVFEKGVYQKYVERVCSDIRTAEQTAAAVGCRLERAVDSLYLGGGTPSILEPAQLEQIFGTLRRNFDVAASAEITMECAPATLQPTLLDCLMRNGVNRVSLGVQSFVDSEARAVGRLHTRATTLDELTRLRRAGLANFNIDLIAGLPHQTADTWRHSLQETVAAGAPHVSVYMLEVDEDSRLGRELIAGGTRYHAHFVPDEDLTADLYVQACDVLEQAGIAQYEISNFARRGCESRHNLKYWTRQPYVGFGVDAHSFLPAVPTVDAEAVRFCSADSLEDYLAGAPPVPTLVSARSAREECFFLGLRLNRGVDLRSLAGQHSFDPQLQRTISQLYEMGMLEYDRKHELIWLTKEGRLLSNEVFERFLGL